MADAGKTRPGPMHITLVGASIGKAWRFEGIGRRGNLSGYAFEYVGNFSFDKSELIQELVARRDKPGMVLIKECSTYFPGDTARYRKDLMTWVGWLRGAGIQPVLVTTAPVSEPGSALARARIIVKHFLGLPAWLDEIAAYNAWLREYAARERLPVFDLEAVLRTSDDDGYLRKEYGAGDMVHLSEAAYRAMDREFAVFLRALDTAVTPRG